MAPDSQATTLSLLFEPDPQGIPRTEVRPTEGIPQVPTPQWLSVADTAQLNHANWLAVVLAIFKLGTALRQ